MEKEKKVEIKKEKVGGKQKEDLEGLNLVY